MSIICRSRRLKFRSGRFFISQRAEKAAYAANVASSRPLVNGFMEQSYGAGSIALAAILGGSSSVELSSSKTARMQLLSPTLLLSVTLAAQGPSLFPSTGPTVPDLAIFDRTVTAIMTKYHLPGGQLSIGKDGRLVLSRAYGYADLEKKQPVDPSSLSPLATVTKT